MKHFFFIFLLVGFALLGHGQASKVDIDPDYFLLGTLDDYMGRENYKKIANQVDSYTQESKSLVFFLDSLLKTKYPDLKLVTHKETGRYEILSPTLAKKIDTFYDYTPSGRSAYTSDIAIQTLNLDSLTKTADFMTTYFDTIYTGSLKSTIFKDDKKRLSFIAGAYLRFGGKTDSISYISISNSVSKIKEATVLLKLLKCTQINYVIKDGYIPSSHTVYFIPTTRLKNYFTTLTKNLAVFAAPQE